MPWIQYPYPLEYLEQAWWIVKVIFLKTAKSDGNNNYRGVETPGGWIFLTWADNHQPSLLLYLVMNLRLDTDRGISVRKISSRLLVVTQNWHDGCKTLRASNTKPLFPWDMFLCLGLLKRDRDMRACSSQKADKSLKDKLFLRDQVLLEQGECLKYTQVLAPFESGVWGKLNSWALNL